MSMAATPHLRDQVTDLGQFVAEVLVDVEELLARRQVPGGIVPTRFGCGT